MSNWSSPKRRNSYNYSRLSHADSWFSFSPTSLWQCTIDSMWAQLCKMSRQPHTVTSFEQVLCCATNLHDSCQTLVPSCAKLSVVRNECTQGCSMVINISWLVKALKSLKVICSVKTIGNAIWPLTAHFPSSLYKIAHSLSLSLSLSLTHTHTHTHHILLLCWHLANTRYSMSGGGNQWLPW